jgi:lysophospholipase L1-like esterase
MSVLIILLGILAAITTAALVLFTLGEIPAVIALVVVLVLMGIGVWKSGGISKAILAVLGILFIATLGFGGFSAFQLYSALTDTSGLADAANAADLASAEAKLDAVEDDGGFRIELTEAELTAVMQDSLAGSDDNPIRAVTLDVVDGEGDDNGQVNFVVSFKGGSLSGDGAVGAQLDAGAVQIEVLDIGIGNLNLPGVATGAIEDIIDTVLDLNDTLAENQADVQAVEIGAERVIIIGTQGDGDLLTSADLLGAIADNAASVAGAVSPPAERFSAGTVNSVSADGAQYYVALGDSLAANVGVSQASDGYVSRFHNQLQIRDSAAYGLRNFGISGETSGTIIRGGQLDEAIAFIENNDVLYITVDIGANDLFGHVGSADCESDFNAEACQQRLTNALAAYGPNVTRILERLSDAAPDATIIFLGTYNPFSFGFGGAVQLENDSDDITQQLNDVAAGAAGAQDVIFADGFTPLQKTTAATTHMFDAPPDIHPKAIGYDLLTGALVDVLP